MTQELSTQAVLLPIPNVAARSMPRPSEMLRDAEPEVKYLPKTA